MEQGTTNRGPAGPTGNTEGKLAGEAPVTLTVAVAGGGGWPGVRGSRGQGGWGAGTPGTATRRGSSSQTEESCGEQRRGRGTGRVWAEGSAFWLRKFGFGSPDPAWHQRWEQRSLSVLHSSPTGTGPEAWGQAGSAASRKPATDTAAALTPRLGHACGPTSLRRAQGPQQRTCSNTLGRPSAGSGRPLRPRTCSTTDTAPLG